MNKDHDRLGGRMKAQYEDRTRMSLPRRTYTILRLDGKAFHTFTRHCAKPFDYRLMAALDNAAVQLCGDMMGVAFGYLQSDEMSFLLTDFASIQTESWFDGNVQKMVSVSAAFVSATFTSTYCDQTTPQIAVFDGRVFTIPDPVEVENYFIWRQKDAERNSISSAAQAVFSHKELHGKNCAEMQDMLHERGQNWNDLPAQSKRGRLVIKESYTVEGAERSRWVATDAPIFTQERERLTALIPVMFKVSPASEQTQKNVEVVEKVEE